LTPSASPALSRLPKASQSQSSGNMSKCMFVCHPRYPEELNIRVGTHVLNRYFHT
jgi:hypothetical protein